MAKVLWKATPPLEIIGSLKALGNHYPTKCNDPLYKFAIFISCNYISLFFQYPINVTNWNFVPLHVESVDLMAFYHAYVLKQTEATLDEWVPARSTKELHINQTLVFDDPIFSV